MRRFFFLSMMSLAKFSPYFLIGGKSQNIVENNLFHIYYCSLIPRSLNLTAAGIKVRYFKSYLETRRLQRITFARRADRVDRAGPIRPFA